ncbi:MAG: signal recognition particle-docking protein FtsY [Acidimicrobiia bacterium]
MPWILLALVVVVFVVGFGVVLYGRIQRRSMPAPPAPGAVRAPERPAAERAAAPAAETLTADELAELEVEALTSVDGAAPGETEVEEPLEVDVDIEPEIIERPRFRDRLARARSAFTGALTSIRGRSGIGADTWDDLEEALLTADVGIGLTTELLDGLRDQVKTDKITDPSVLLDRLKADVIDRLGGLDRSLRFDGVAGHPDVWLFVGVNGVGKTTTIGKIGAQQKAIGRSVLMAAGDTFRAAAAEQLGMWADRSGADLVRGDEGADPAAIIFDGVERASARGVDLVLADTAGRLHTKSNLMEELRKMRRVAEKGAGVVTETLLVLDATTGQNGLVQARQFTEAVDVTGVVLTKLDGSAKGGIVLAIQHELGIPVKLVGLGEGIGDLTPFEPEEFASALFD